jgi:hypothetical protein
LCGVGAHHQTSQNHVDGGGEKDGSDQDKDRLDDIWSLVLRIIMGCCSCGIPDRLELRTASVKVSRVEYCDVPKHR